MHGPGYVYGQVCRTEDELFQSLLYERFRIELVRFVPAVTQRTSWGGRPVVAVLSDLPDIDAMVSPRDNDTVTVLAVAELEEEVLLYQRRTADDNGMRCAARINMRLGREQKVTAGRQLLSAHTHAVCFGGHELRATRNNMCFRKHNTTRPAASPLIPYA